MTKHCVKSARIAYLHPEEALQTNTRPIRSWREYLFIAHPCVMHVYAFMLRCRHSYAAPFSAEGFGRILIREIATAKARCQVHKRFLHSSSPHHPLNGDSPVKTQNFASHEKVFARRGSDNVLTTGAFVARETQDFASLLWWTAILYSGNRDGIMVATAL